ncbi:GFA family protein [Roseomonas sp. OT10]|uniref:GFA family protein n=1 Tax=Roseomonas cutis TaxID=2897332 RepID=UPI001E60CB92|nr:GFA family protein [Roseomonas sp. OT10]UFN47125.1 GFA family protein [Roseomonas sp. OT10]
MLQGGCLCGQVRYEAEGAPFHPTICHCGMCRRAAGAPMVAWFSVPREGFRWVAGEPARYASSPGATRCFCRRCGTSLTFAAAQTPDEIDVTTASLDDPEAVPPRDHTHVATRLSWVATDDGLPAYRDRRLGG